MKEKLPVLRAPSLYCEHDEERLKQGRHLEELLDEALKETFPASDPIAVYVPGLEERAEGPPPGRERFGAPPRRESDPPAPEHE